ncbi:hypothetical protein C8R42DRAFT_639246 [Lentinula raphanica]|nr:hypothetical protein C8R42DRAFT_639246 [Lentinula raphanica]
MSSALQNTQQGKTGLADWTAIPQDSGSKRKREAFRESIMKKGGTLRPVMQRNSRLLKYVLKLGLGERENLVEIFIFESRLLDSDHGPFEKDLPRATQSRLVLVNSGWYSVVLVDSGMDEIEMKGRQLLVDDTQLPDVSESFADELVTIHPMRCCLVLPDVTNASPMLHETESYIRTTVGRYDRFRVTQQTPPSDVLCIRDTIRSEISLEATWSNASQHRDSTAQSQRVKMLFRGLTRFSVISSFSNRRVRRRAEGENEEEEENENENEEEKEREELLRRATKKRRSEALPGLLDYKHSRGC